MRYDPHDLHQMARACRARYIGELASDALAALIQLVRKAWRSSSSKGTNSRALS